MSVPSELKPDLLAYLRQAHGISHQSIYTDIVGFVDFQDMLLDGFMITGPQSLSEDDSGTLSDFAEWLSMLSSRTE